MKLDHIVRRLFTWFDDVVMGPALLSRTEFIRASNFWMLILSGARGIAVDREASLPKDRRVVGKDER